MIDALLKAGPANITDVVVSYDDTSRRVTLRRAKDTVLELRGDIARMFGYLNNTAVGFTLALPETGNQFFFIFIQISSRVNIMVMLLFLFFVLLQ